LTYTWSATGSPPAPVNFSVNGTNDAKNTIATFTKAGTYNFQVQVTNQSSAYTIGTVSVQVNQTATSVSVTPATTSVAAKATDQDQFGNPMPGSPAVTWSVVSGAGSITSAGLYAAGRTSGSATIRATESNGHFGNSTVTIFYEETAWYQFDSANATQTDSSG